MRGRARPPPPAPPRRLAFRAFTTRPRWRPRRADDGSRSAPRRPGRTSMRQVLTAVLRDGLGELITKPGDATAMPLWNWPKIPQWAPLQPEPVEPPEQAVPSKVTAPRARVRSSSACSGVHAEDVLGHPAASPTLRRGVAERHRLLHLLAEVDAGEEADVAERHVGARHRGGDLRSRRSRARRDGDSPSSQRARIGMTSIIASARACSAKRCWARLRRRRTSHPSPGFRGDAVERAHHQADGARLACSGGSGGSETRRGANRSGGGASGRRPPEARPRPRRAAPEVRRQLASQEVHPLARALGREPPEEAGRQEPSRRKRGVRTRRLVSAGMPAKASRVVDGRSLRGFARRHVGRGGASSSSKSASLCGGRGARRGRRNGRRVRRRGHPFDRGRRIGRHDEPAVVERVERIQRRRRRAARAELERELGRDGRSRRGGRQAREEEASAARVAQTARARRR